MVNVFHIIPCVMPPVIGSLDVQFYVCMLHLSSCMYHSNFLWSISWSVDRISFATHTV